MFEYSNFSGSLDNWCPINAKYISDIVKNCNAPVPYWANITHIQERQLAIETYQHKKALEQVLEKQLKKKSMIKI